MDPEQRKQVDAYKQALREHEAEKAQAPYTASALLQTIIGFVIIFGLLILLGWLREIGWLL